jgi:hypothetical protein
VSIYATLRPLAAAAALLGASGCEATFTPAPVQVAASAPVVQAVVVPDDIYSAPRVYYGDTWLYLYGGIWYYSTPRGWMVYRDEPRELGRIRTRIQSQPRAYQQAPAYSSPRSAPRRPVYQAPQETGRERTPR